MGIRGVTIENRIRNGYLEGVIGVALTVNRIREHRLSWFGHVVRIKKSEVI